MSKDPFLISYTLAASIEEFSFLIDNQKYISEKILGLIFVKEFNVIVFLLVSILSFQVHQYSKLNY